MHNAKLYLWPTIVPNSASLAHSNGSLVTTIKPNAEEFRTVAKLLLYILPAYEYYPNRSRLSFHGILPYTL
jgi:hypothetical protein